MIACKVMVSTEIGLIQCGKSAVARAVYPSSSGDMDVFFCEAHLRMVKPEMFERLPVMVPVP